MIPLLRHQPHYLTVPVRNRREDEKMGQLQDRVKKTKEAKDMGVFFKPARMDPLPQMRGSMRKLLVMDPPKNPTAIDELVSKELSEVQTTTGGALEPRWKVFIGAAVLMVVLLVVMYYVATAADAQPKEMTTSQLKTLSSALITAFTALSGGVVGMITGEAVSKKEE